MVAIEQSVVLECDRKILESKRCDENIRCVNLAVLCVFCIPLNIIPFSDFGRATIRKCYYRIICNHNRIHGDVYDLAKADKTEERALQEEAFHKVDKIVSISDITTQSLLDLFPNHKDKIEIIYNGIDVEETRKKQKKLQRFSCSILQFCLSEDWMQTRIP